MNKKTIIVPNVHEFPGHISCENLSNSEIAVPLLKDNKIIDVLDVDSTKLMILTKLMNID